MNTIITGYYKKAFNELEEQINELLFEQDNLLASYEQVVEIILQKMTKLKEYVLKTGFKNTQEEIHFFKTLSRKVCKLKSLGLDFII